MNKCVLITALGDLTNEALQNFLNKEAHKGSLQGTAHSEGNDHIKIALFGAKDKVDQFVDNLYDHSAKLNLSDIEVEPFFKNKDFRGVFRILK